MDSFSSWLYRLFFPVKCMGCQAVTLGSAPFCRECTVRFAGLVKAPCPTCGEDRGNCTCAGMHSMPFLFYYDTPFSKRVIASLKHHATRFKADYIASLVFNLLPRRKKIDAVVYPPRSAKNIRVYGFDQSRMVATALAAKLGVPCLPALKRVRKAKQQKLLSAVQRRRNMKGTFSADPTALAGIGSVVLFDDVMTTGATLGECVRALKEAGVKHVYPVVAARTPRAKKAVFSRKKYRS